MPQENRAILAVVSDLFFSVKISDAAKRAEMPVEFVRNEEDVMARVETLPALIVIDLNFDQVKPVDVISKLKSNLETRQIPIIGFVSHVQGELIRRAKEAGCDTVLARSAFSQNMQQILKLPKP